MSESNEKLGNSENAFPKSKNRVKTDSLLTFLLQDKECFQVLLVSICICKPSGVLKHSRKVLSLPQCPKHKTK